MSGIQAARAAAALKNEPGVEVTTVPGRYGELTVLVDGEPVVKAGPLAFLGIVPSLRKIREAVLRRTGRPRTENSGMSEKRQAD